MQILNNIPICNHFISVAVRIVKAELFQTFQALPDFKSTTAYIATSCLLQ